MTVDELLGDLDEASRLGLGDAWLVLLHDFGTPDSPRDPREVSVVSVMLDPQDPQVTLSTSDPHGAPLTVDSTAQQLRGLPPADAGAYSVNVDGPPEITSQGWTVAPVRPLSTTALNCGRRLFGLIFWFEGYEEFGLSWSDPPRRTSASS